MILPIFYRDFNTSLSICIHPHCRPDPLFWP